MNRLFGWLLGLDDVVSIDEIEPTLAAPWASNEYGAFWVILAIGAVMAAALVFYLKWQDRGSRSARIALGIARGVILALLVLTLAEPVLRLTTTSRQNPTVFVVLDGTDSMGIRDPMTPTDRATLEKALEITKPTNGAAATTNNATNSDDAPAVSRREYVQALLRKKDGEWLRRLERERGVTLQPFLFDGHTTSQLRRLVDAGATKGAANPVEWAEKLTAEGQVTALGNVLDDASQQTASGHLAGVILISDFAQNSGISPLAGGSDSPLARLGVPVYTVGVGAVETVDLAIDIQVSPTMKKGERDTISVSVRSTGLTGQTASVQVTARKLGGEEGESSVPTVVGQQTVVLQGDDIPPLKFPFTPSESGRFQFSAQATPLPGEVLDQNNHAAREATVIDDYLRLTYVAFEPTWEWRFIKEVFHRDKLVGLSGFRT